MRIKAKSGYNVILDDIKIALHHGKDFIEVDDKVFASSNDAKRFKDLIEIDIANQKKVSSDSKANKSKKDPFNVVQTAANVFVINSDDNNKKSDIIVADPNHELKKQQPVATKKAELVKVNEETPKAEPLKNEPVKTETVNKEVVKANEASKNESSKVEQAKSEFIKNDTKVSTKADEFKKVDNKSKTKVDAKAATSKDKK